MRHLNTGSLGNRTGQAQRSGCRAACRFEASTSARAPARGHTCLRRIGAVSLAVVTRPSGWLLYQAPLMARQSELKSILSGTLPAHHTSFDGTSGASARVFAETVSRRGGATVSMFEQGPARAIDR